jgi:hypothetical protein
MFRKLTAFALFTVGIALLALPAQAASGTTSISINLPSFVMLYYRSSVTFLPSDATMTALIGEAANPADLGNIDLTAFTDDAAVDGDGSGYTGLTSVTATVSNFWAVRSLAPSGGLTEVSVAWSGGSTLTNPNSDTMALSNLETQASGGTWGASDTFTPTGLGPLTSATQGDVRFDVDLSNAATSGNYSGASILITALNI